MTRTSQNADRRYAEDWYTDSWSDRGWTGRGWTDHTWQKSSWYNNDWKSSSPGEESLGKPTSTFSWQPSLHLGEERKGEEHKVKKDVAWEQPAAKPKKTSSESNSRVELVTIPIPAPVVGRLIGKQGSGIQDLSVATGCKLQVVKGEDDERQLSISSKKLEMVQQAAVVVQRRISRLTWEISILEGVDGTSAIETIHLPLHLVSHFVGKDGQTIQELRSSVDCALQVRKDDENAEVLVGCPADSPEEVKRAVEVVQMKIFDMLEKSLESKLTKTISDTSQVMQRIPIPASVAGRLIGKNGSGIQELCASTGCKLKVLKNDGREQLAIYSGSMEQAEQAAATINRKVSHLRWEISVLSSSEEAVACDTIDLPLHLVSHFVGKEGLVIQELRSSLDCALQVRKGCDHAEVLVGSPADSSEVVRKAAEAVQKKINQLLEDVDQSAPTATQSQSRINAAIKDIVLRRTGDALPIHSRDFDTKVMRYLLALLQIRGFEQVRSSLDHVREVTAGMRREAVKNWRAYVLTLLQRFNVDCKLALEASVSTQGAEYQDGTLSDIRRSEPAAVPFLDAEDCEDSSVSPGYTARVQ